MGQGKIYKCEYEETATEKLMNDLPSKEDILKNIYDNLVYLFSNISIYIKWVTQKFSKKTESK